MRAEQEYRPPASWLGTRWAGGDGGLIGMGVTGEGAGGPGGQAALGWKAHVSGWLRAWPREPLRRVWAH